MHKQEKMLRIVERLKGIGIPNGRAERKNQEVDLKNN